RLHRVDRARADVTEDHTQSAHQQREPRRVMGLRVTIHQRGHLLLPRHAQPPRSVRPPSARVASCLTLGHYPANGWSADPSISVALPRTLDRVTPPLHAIKGEAT